MDLRKILWSPSSPASSPSSSHQSKTVHEQDNDDENDIITPERRKQFFKMAHGRKVSSIAKHYPLPVDEEEINRMNEEHRMLRYILHGPNYIGPVKEVLEYSDERQRRVLDCGTGTGIWAWEMADEFLHAEVIGVDVVPIQPEYLTLSSSFEIYDISKGRRLLPYESGYFDLVHMRSIHTGIPDYAALLREAHRVLRPGGLLLLVEFETTPMTATKQHIVPGADGGLPGWCGLWDEYRRCATRRGIDVTVPTRLRTMLHHMGGFERVTALEVGLTCDEIIQTIGQLAWMNYQNLLYSLRPLILEHSSLSMHEVDGLLEAAQEDLYNDNDIRPNVCLHIVHATKL
ncbi:S-adenosyl-L-methionine-dependent methyltransferase [Hysterangium stoloniferum]|nr:S-adenosyl-L-methionine-dependent methyltransferase [Hysterangium stoloniferum]